MKVQAGTPMTEVIKQYAELSGIDEAECRFLVGGKPLKTDKPSRARVPPSRAAPSPAREAPPGEAGSRGCLVLRRPGPTPRVAPAGSTSRSR